MDKNYTFQELLTITQRVIKEFDKVERRSWNIEVTMIELMKQVGDLSKHVLMFEKYYLQDREHLPEYKTSKEDIADELADILYCVIRVAEYYQIDLEDAHLKARRAELKSLNIEPDF